MNLQEQVWTRPLSSTVCNTDNRCTIHVYKISDLQISKNDIQ